MYESAIGEAFMPRAHPTLTVQVVKMDNGYIVTLQEIPRPKPSRRIVVPNPFEGKSPDEIIDQMIDGVGAVLRTFRQAEAEEEWKGSEDRETVRTAFKALFPNLAQQAFTLTEAPESEEDRRRQEPRQEQNVFGSKAELMKYLDQNFPGA